MRIVAIALLCLLFGACGGGGGGAATGDLISSAPQIVGRRAGVYVEGDGPEKRADLIIDQPEGPDARRCRAALSLIEPTPELAGRPGATLGANAVAFTGWVTVSGSRVLFESEGVSCQWRLVGSTLAEGTQPVGGRFLRCGFPWLGAAVSLVVTDTYTLDNITIHVQRKITGEREPTFVSDRPTDR